MHEADRPPRPRFPEREMVEQVCSFYNGSWFRLEELVSVIKRIDRKYSAAAIREATRSLADEGVLERSEQRRVPLYGIHTEGVPMRLYEGREEHHPGARLAARQDLPHEDIIPMDGWEEGR